MVRGFDIAKAQLEGMGNCGLLSNGGVVLHLFITHISNSSIASTDGTLSGHFPKGAEAVAALRALATELNGDDAKVDVEVNNHWEWPALHGLWAALFWAHPEEAHAGIAPASGGHEWYNFWWARPEYVAQLDEPKKPLEGIERHYYEWWLGIAAQRMVREL